MPVNTLENHTSLWVTFTQMPQEGRMPECLQQKMSKIEVGGEEKEERKLCGAAITVSLSTDVVG